MVWFSLVLGLPFLADWSLLTNWSFLADWPFILSSLVLLPSVILLARVILLLRCGDTRFLLLAGILWMRIRSILRMRIVLRVRTGIRRILGILLIVKVIVMHLRIVRRHSSHFTLILIVPLLRVRIGLRVILRMLRDFRLPLSFIPLSFGISLLSFWIVVRCPPSIVVAHIINISIIKQDPFVLFLGWLMRGVAVQETALQKLKVFYARIVLVFFLLEGADL